MSNLREVIEESFSQYAGAVLQSRALVDVRDCLKPSARQIFYCLYTDKFTHSKPFKKTLKAIGSASRMYIHGDSSAEGIIMRAGQPFSMRYPLIEVEGSYGNLMESGNWAAPRYTASRLTVLNEKMFSGVEKNTITAWLDNYDDTEKYPTVLPSIGFYNIVNGTMGIGIGASSSIPPTNLKEVNDAIIKVIKNPEVAFEEIVCYPDFPTGGIVLNKKEIKESLENGQGASCKVRSVIEYNADENCLIVSEIPYMVYTKTICEELEKILVKEEENSPIERFNDLTGETPEIKIYLKKGKNPKKVIKYLYANTSLESYFSINFTMLKDGKRPKVFGWKDCLQEYITHIRSCKTREVQFDLDKALSRKNIVEALICAAASIDEIVALIRGSSNPAEASSKLTERFNFNEEQIKAILAMKLSSLTKIDAIKLEDEKKELLSKIEWFQHLLDDAAALDEELIKVLREVAEKFGDDRRTKILNEVEEDEEIEEVQEDELEIAVYDNNTICAVKKGEKRKSKLKKNVKQIGTLYSTNFGRLSIFTKDGKMYTLPLSEVEYDVDFILPYDNVVVVIDNTSLFNYKHILFITRQGMIKKSKTSEYNCRVAAKGTSALNLRDGDSVVNVFFSSNENDRILIAANSGYAVFYNHSEIAAIGRASLGVKAIKLKENEYVADATIIKESIDCKEVLMISTKKKEKTVPLVEIVETSRATKGKLLWKMGQDEELFICQGQS